MIDELNRLIGKEKVFGSDMQIRLYEYDAALLRSKPDCIVLPATTEDVSKVVKFAYSNGIPVVARGPEQISRGAVSACTAALP